MLRDDPNESSAVYLLTSDDEYAVCGTNFSPNQLLCRKYLATKFFFVEETFDHVPGNEKDQVWPICRYRTNLGDFRHRRTMILKVYINGHENGRKSRKGTQQRVNEFFTNLPAKTWIACSRFRDSGEKSFSKKKCEKRHRALSQVARVLFSLCSF